MLLTSGVIRSSIVDPPRLAASPSQNDSLPHNLSRKNPGSTQLIHFTDPLHRFTALARWQSTLIDALKEFGKR